MILLDILEARAATFADKTALTAPDGVFSYAELAAAARQCGDWLEARDVGRGDRVAYLGYNSAALILLIFAASRLGAIVSPLNWRLSGRELRWIIDDADPALIVADEHFEEAAERAAENRPIAPSAPLVRERPPAHPAPAQPEPRGRSAADPVLLAYTSGASGRPKGALLSNRAIMANATMSVDMHAMTPADHVLTVLPMFHVGGLNIQTLPALLIGASVTLTGRFEADECLQLIGRVKPTLTVQVPATFQALMSAPGWEGADLSSLRVIATGSTDVPVPVIEAIHARQIPVIQIYGATETGPVVVYQRREDAHSQLGSIGRAGPGVDIRLVGTNGVDMAEGDAGEIWVRSPTLADGYWRNEAASDAFRGGWFRTGDVAARDENGFLWFRDRIKNVIISGGENIYPAELERVLRDLPGVVEAAVVGRPDPRWEAVPVAFIVKDAALIREDVLAWFEGRLARYKHPKDVIFLEALPRNAMGKVVPAKLKEMLEA